MVMSVMEKISELSKNGCDDALLNYICDNYDEIECKLNRDEVHHLNNTMLVDTF